MSAPSKKLAHPKDLKVERKEKKKKSKSKVNDEKVKSEIDDLVALMTRVERKAVLLESKNGSALMHEPSCVTFEPTKTSEIYRTVLSRMFAGRQYAFRIAAVLNMSSSGSGVVSNVIGNASLSGNVDFTTLSTVFNEFFIERFDCKWEPVSLNNYPLTGVPATSVSSLPMGVASLQHGATAYSAISSMANNYKFLLTNTGRAFAYSWVNVEKRSSTVLAVTTTSGLPVQSWALTSDAANYSGQVQLLTPIAPPLPVSQVLGVFLVEWLVYFRVRE